MKPHEAVTLRMLKPEVRFERTEGGMLLFPANEMKFTHTKDGIALSVYQGLNRLVTMDLPTRVPMLRGDGFDIYFDDLYLGVRNTEKVYVPDRR